MTPSVDRSFPSWFRILAITAVLLVAGMRLAARLQAQEAPPTWAAKVDSLVEAELARTKTPGAQVAIALDGKVVYSKGYGVADIETGRAVSAQTLFRIGSVTKMVTGAIAGELAAEGKLDLNAPIARYVTELEGKKVGTVTTHQLLTHTAGWIDNAIPYGRMGEGALGEVMTEVSDTLFFTEPGRIISYSNPGYSMAGYVIERASGQRFGRNADERILRRFGMPHASFRPLEVMTRDFSQGHVGQPGNPGAVVRPFTENTAQWAAGFLMASAQDMARFAIAVLDNGMLDGTRVLQESTVQGLVTGDPSIPGNDGAQEARYAHGIMVAKTARGDRVWQHGGAINGFDAVVTMFPDKRLAVVLLDNRSGPSVDGLNRLVAREVVGLEIPDAPEPPAERAPTADERKALVGKYAMGRTQLALMERGDSLFVQQGMLRIPAQMRGEDRLVITPPNGAKQTMLLVKDASGRVAYLHLGLRAIARVE